MAAMCDFDTDRKSFPVTGDRPSNVEPGCARAYVDDHLDPVPDSPMTWNAGRTDGVKTRIALWINGHRKETILATAGVTGVLLGVGLPGTIAGVIAGTIVGAIVGCTLVFACSRFCAARNIKREAMNRAHLRELERYARIAREEEDRTNSGGRMLAERIRYAETPK
ncbi:MAG: hypothetical protein OXF02_00770 [Simkaniaceae bacterium]|nr:hypothetical protein [Simkaniaceae bacterium]